jgi:hypothetical protein
MSQPDTESDTDTEKSESAARKGPKKVPRGKPRLKLPSTAEGKSRWPTYAALAIAVIALAVAITAWFRPAHSGTPSFNDQQTADAKKSVCRAYTSVKQSVVVNTHMTNPNGDDPVGQLAVAANARLALLGGGQYLRDRLAAAPAAPAELAKAVTSMATTIEDLGIGYLSGESAVAQDPLRNDLNSEIGQIDALCA